jgi:hypothetical protein
VTLLLQASLVTALAALGATGWWVAGRTGARHSPRILAAVVLAASLMVLHSLLLGLLGLSDAPAAFLGLAVGTAALVRPLRPLGADPLFEQSWVDRRARAIAGALAGAWIVTAVHRLARPYLSLDSVVNHAAQPVAWLQRGEMASLTPVSANLPFEHYPLTHEVLVAWGLAAGRAFPWLSLLGSLVWGVLGLATYVAVRGCGGARTFGLLAALAAVSLPMCVVQDGGSTDLPATAWTVAAVALAIAARRTPGAIGFALLACGLAGGTKTTAAVLPLLAVAPVAIACLRARSASRWMLLGSLVAAAVIGGVWPARNLLTRGAPLWPFSDAPAGDAIPPAFDAVDDRFLDHASDMLDGRGDLYLQTLGGAAVLLLLSLLLPMLTRRTIPAGLGALTIVGSLAWVMAPFTAIPITDGLAVGSLRYLLPTVGIAIVAVAAAASEHGIERLGRWVMVMAVIWSVLSVAQLGMDEQTLPSLGWLLVGVAGGAIAALALRSSESGGVGASGRWAALGSWAGLAVVVLLAATTTGWTERAAENLDAAGNELGEPITATLQLLDAVDGGRVASFPATFAQLGGDRLSGDVVLIAADTGCPALLGLALDHAVVIFGTGWDPRADRLAACLATIGPAAQGLHWKVWGPAL